jgi:hypothetical protein
MDRDREREADVRAARRLDVGVKEIQEASRSLWGHSLFSEREKRAPETDNRSAAARAHVTRKLYVELDSRLKRDSLDESSPPLS